ncbi:MAG: TetR/AcrR family transcriptional regulator [Acidobacteria bacterium]|nr:TetR/AcrR family transcriptional regulator [Acidobacteriota bacterium]
MRGPTASPKAQQSADTRKAILDSCLQLFAKHGFSPTSIDDIARAAGITKGAVYWHFTSKKELFEAILAQIRTRWQEIVQVPTSKETSPIARLETLFSCYSKLFTEAPDICLFLQRILLEQHQEFSPQVARVFAQTARFISRILEDGKAHGLFREDLDCVVTAHMILGSLSGATQQSLTSRGPTLRALLGEAKNMTLARIRR